MATNLTALSYQGLRAASYTKRQSYDDRSFAALTENLLALDRAYEGLTESAKKLTNAYSSLNDEAQNRISSLSSEVELYGLLSVAVVGATSQIVDMISTLEYQAQQVESFTSGLEQFPKIEVLSQQFDTAQKSMISAQEVISRERQLAQTGLSKQSIQAGQQMASQLATATFGGMEYSTDIIIKLLNALGTPLDQLESSVDYIVSQVNRTNLDIQQISETFKYTAPVFGSMNVKINEAMGMIGALAQSGLTGSLMGTSIRRILLQLATFETSWGTGNQTDKYLQQLFPEGLNYYGPNGSIDVIKAFETMQENIDNLDVNLAAQMKQLFGQRAIQAVLRLLSREDGELVITKFVNRVTEGQQGYTEAKAEEAMSSSLQSFKVLGDNIQQMFTDMLKPFTNILQAGANTLSSAFQALRGNIDETSKQIKRAGNNLKEQGKSLLNREDPFASILGMVGTVGISVLLSKIFRPLIKSISGTFSQISRRGTSDRVISNLGLFEPGIKPTIQINRQARQSKYGRQFEQMLQASGYQNNVSLLETNAPTQLRREDVKRLTQDKKLSQSLMRFLEKPSDISRKRELQGELQSSFITNAIDRSVQLDRIYSALETISGKILDMSEISGFNKVKSGEIGVDEYLGRISPFITGIDERYKRIDDLQKAVYSGNITDKKVIADIQRQHGSVINNKDFQSIYGEQEYNSAKSRQIILEALSTGTIGEIRAITGQYNTSLSKLQEQLTKGFSYRTTPPMVMDKDLRNFIDNIGAYVDPGSFQSNKRQQDLTSSYRQHLQSFVNPRTGKMQGLSYKQTGYNKGIVRIKGEEGLYNMVIPGTIYNGEQDITTEQYKKSHEQLLKTIEERYKNTGITYQQLQEEQQKAGLTDELRNIVKTGTGFTDAELKRLGITSGESNMGNFKKGDLLFRAIFQGQESDIRNISNIFGKIEKMSLAGNTDLARLFDQYTKQFSEKYQPNTPQYDYLTRLRNLTVGKEYGLMNPDVRSLLMEQFGGQKSFEDLTQNIKGILSKNIEELDIPARRIKNIFSGISQQSGIDFQSETGLKRLSSTIQNMGILSGNKNFINNIMQDKAFSGGNNPLSEHTIFKSFFHGTAGNPVQKQSSGIEQFFTLLQAEMSKQADQQQSKGEKRLIDAAQKSSRRINYSGFGTKMLVPQKINYAAEGSVLRNLTLEMNKQGQVQNKQQEEVSKVNGALNQMQTTQNKTSNQPGIWGRIGGKIKSGLQNSWFGSIMMSQIGSTIGMFASGIVGGLIPMLFKDQSQAKFSQLQQTPGSQISSIQYAKAFDLQRYEREYGVEFSQSEKQYFESIRTNLENVLEKVKSSAKSSEEIQRAEQEYINGLEQQRQEVLQTQQKRSQNTFLTILSQQGQMAGPGIMAGLGNMLGMSKGNPWIKFAGVGALSTQAIMAIQYFTNVQQEKELEQMMRQREMELAEKRHQETLQELRRINEDMAQFDLSQFRAQQYITVTVNSSEEAQRELEKWRDYSIGVRRTGYNFMMAE